MVARRMEETTYLVGEWTTVARQTEEAGWQADDGDRWNGRQ